MRRQAAICRSSISADVSRFNGTEGTVTIIRSPRCLTSTFFTNLTLLSQPHDTSSACRDDD
jgi:hypothetical protein